MPTIAEVLLPELDQEMAGTRRALERVPLDRADWRPHEKSMPLGYLAAHIADLPKWAILGLKEDSFDLAPPDGEPYRNPEHDSVESLLAAFDANVAEARSVIAAASDDAFGESWTLLQGGETLFTIPRLSVVRTFVLNHVVHHRGQLTVYLRLNGVPVPGLYGPSADEAI